MDATVQQWLGRARIDIKNQGDGNDVKMKMDDGNKCNMWKADWFSEGGNGYVIETSDHNIVINIECIGTGDLLLRLMGIDRRSGSGDRLPLWVDYTRLAINNEVVFWELKPQCHDKFYVYNRSVVDGEKLKIEISWDFHGYKGEELANLISLWNNA